MSKTFERGTFEDLRIEHWITELEEALVARWIRLFNEITNAMNLPRLHVSYAAERSAQRWVLPDGREILCGPGFQPERATRCGIVLQKLIVLRMALPISSHSTKLRHSVLARVRATFLEFIPLGSPANVRTAAVHNFIGRLAHFSRPMLIAAPHLSPQEAISVPQTLRRVYENFSETMLKPADEADAIGAVSWAVQSLEHTNPKHIKYLKVVSSPTISFAPDDADDAKLLFGVYLSFLKDRQRSLRKLPHP